MGTRSGLVTEHWRRCTRCRHRLADADARCPECGGACPLTTMTVGAWASVGPMSWLRGFLRLAVVGTALLIGLGAFMNGDIVMAAIASGTGLLATAFCWSWIRGALGPHLGFGQRVLVVGSESLWMTGLGGLIHPWCDIEQVALPLRRGRPRLIVSTRSCFFLITLDCDRAYAERVRDEIDRRRWAS